MNDFVAYTSRWRTGLMVVGSLGFVIIGAWMTGLIWPAPISTRASPHMQMIWGWISIAFFGLCAVQSAKSWWSNGEQLRIGEKGIRWSRWNDQTIPWDEISNVTEWRYKRSKFIVLHIRNPSHFPGKGIVGFAAKMNRSIAGGDIGITLTGTDRKFDDATAAIAHFRSER